MAIITLADAKAHLGIVDDADNSLISAKIDAAQAYIEAQIGFELDEDSPADLIEAVRQMTAHFFENREATIVGVSIVETPASVADAIRSHRLWWADPIG